jgi:diguanylate cyclase (GGDEF)-like protein/PAS domain S-box-containing protein
MRKQISKIFDPVSRVTTTGLLLVQSIRRGPVLWLTLCGGLLVASIIVGTIIMAGEFRERAIANNVRELENTVTLVARHFDQLFEDTERVADDVVSQLGISSIASPELFNEKLSTPEAHGLLKSRVSVLSYIGDVIVFDSDGNLVNASGAWPPPKVNIAERAYFQRLKFDPQSRTVLTEPGHSIYTGNWTTIIAHRLSGPNGVFLGVMTRRIDPESFEKFFASVALGQGASIAMFHGDGTMLARYPHLEGQIGKKLNKSLLMERALTLKGPQTVITVSPVDNQDRLVSATALTRQPIVVFATNTVDAALADWRTQTRTLVAVAVVSALLVAIILFLIIREITRQNRDAQRRLESEKHRLDTALNNMMQGLVLYDASARVVTFNQRYIDMYKLSTDVVKPGLHYYDLIQHRKDTGSFDGDVRAFCDPILRDVSHGRVSRTIMESADGRAFHIVNKPLAQGGWVATIEDITERRNLEQERDRNHAFLREIIDHIPSQITVKDARDRRYVLVNSVAENLFGLPRADIVGKTCFDLLPQPVAQRITGDDDRSLQSRESLFIDEHRFESRTVGSRYITSKRLAIRDHAGAPRYIINVVEDVTERRRADEKIAHLAHYDALTDLPNRVLFREQIDRELQKAAKGGQFALLYIDIDEFKGINDSLGHHVGDELLKSVGASIRACLREDDLIARLGGDEFAVIQTAIAGPADVVEFVMRIYEAIRQPYQCLGHQLSTDASIGIALAPQDGLELDQLIKNADLAMYAAKAEGRRTYRFFEPAMDASAKARLTMEQDLRQAVVNRGFEIHYQPLVALGNGKVTGCEALLRWRHPERGMISPAEFIPIAEDTGLIHELGDWVMQTACAEAANWPETIRLAVNVSPIQLKSPTLALRIAAALAASGLKPDRLEVEITEAVLIRDDEAALAILHQLRGIGVRIALDDFGTGYSSLSYLKRFPFDKIKIDRCFVSDISETDGSSSIVQAVVNIAAALNMTTAAEGVETDMQRELLRRLGCTEMQGYLFSAPKPAADVKRLFGPVHEGATAAA